MEDNSTQIIKRGKATNLLCGGVSWWYEFREISIKWYESLMFSWIERMSGERRVKKSDFFFVSNESRENESSARIKKLLPPSHNKYLIWVMCGSYKND